MVDVNKLVRETLGQIPDAAVVFYYPDDFKTLPVISYYELSTGTGASWDNAEQAQRSHVSIDIWGRSGAECGRLAQEVDALMQRELWKREMSRDMIPQDNIYHKTMRFCRLIFFE